MTFDVIGIYPKNETGEYFGSNNWRWRRLWDFCCHITPEITRNDQENGHWNDGHTITGRKHQALLKSLARALSERDKHNEWIEHSEFHYSMLRGAWAEQRFETVAKSKGVIREEEMTPAQPKYPFDWRHVERFYDFVANNEGFDIW